MSRKRFSCAAALSNAIAVSLGLCSLLPSSARAVDDNQGTEFWLVFFLNGRDPIDEPPRDLGLLHVYVTAQADTSGTIWSPDPRGTPIGVPYSQDFEVSAGATTLIDLDEFPFIGPAIQVVTDNEVAVHALNWWPGSADGFVVFPVDALGKEHLVMTVHHTGGLNSLSGNSTRVVGTVDGTEVTILRRRDTYADDPPYTITLDRGEVFRFSSFTDMSGSEVIADQPVAVFSGNRRTSIPGEGDPGDGPPPPDEPIEAHPFSRSHMVEQMPPTKAWGRLFYLASLAERPDGYVARVLAAQDGTNVSINGAAFTLDRGQVHKQIVQAPAEIVADAPVLVAQLITSRQRDEEDYERTFDHEPSMMLVPPHEQFLDEYLITTPPESLYAFHYVNLVAPAAAVGSITIDGTAVPAESFEPIGNSGFSGAQVPIAPGTHTLAGPLPFSVAVYGYDPSGPRNGPEAYSYPGGMSLSEVARVTSVTLEPEMATHAVGSSGCVGASVIDQAQPLKDVRVDFAVTGANPSLGHDWSDADGIAEYCYTGTVAGEDEIVASVSTFSDSASKLWVDPAEQGVAEIRFRPGSISCHSRGLHQLTVYGSAEFDVRDIVPTSVRLERADGIGTALGPPSHYRVRDLGRGTETGWHRRDGIADAGMRFHSSAIAGLIGCPQVPADAVPPLVVTGQLDDGTRFKTDSATLTRRGRR